jgi:hypothetical protein
MLDPDLVLNSVIAAFQAIPDVVAQLGGLTSISGDPTIAPHYYYSGLEHSLAADIYQMEGPTILVYYLDMLGGNFSQETIWKHRLEACVRPKNAASGPGVVPPSGFGPYLPIGDTPYLCWLMMHSSVSPPLGYIIPPGSNTTSNIRQIRLLPNLALMETPTLKHRIDEQGQDYFCWQMVFPELGDD